MRYFITLSLLVFFSLCSSAWAQQGLSKAQAEEFYQECMKYPHPLQDEFSKKYFCSCASNNFYQRLTPRDAESLKFPSTERGKFAHKKLVMQVYSPCMDEPVSDFLYYECTGTSYLDGVENFDKGTYCACQQYRIPMLLKQTSRIMRTELRAADNVIEDPLTSYLTNEYFIQNTNEISQICFDYAKTEPPPPLTRTPQRGEYNRPQTAPLLSTPGISPYNSQPYSDMSE